jgi:PncC family amidohydrolase
MVDPVFAAAQTLADVLRQNRRKVVFAESCTGGLVSATLARIPGVSEWHCGSAVVYRLNTKHQWLGVPEALLDDPGPVSREVAEAMATGVLSRTPEADIAAAVTGHLGPHAPTEQDGLIWIAIALRESSGDPFVASANSHRLPDTSEPGLTIRESRQRLAARLVLELATSANGGWPPPAVSF